MLTTLAFVATLGLTPAQGGKLEISNVRPTYGVLGAARPDTKFLPGDTFFLAFDIDNVKVADDGRVQYGMTMEVTDAKSKVWFKEDKEQEKLQAVNYLGGTRLPAFANVDIGLNMPPGEYTLKVNVTTSKAQLDAATAARDTAAARVRALESRVADRLIRAPFAGVLGLRSALAATAFANRSMPTRSGCGTSTASGKSATASCRTSVTPAPASHRVRRATAGRMTLEIHHEWAPGPCGRIAATSRSAQSSASETARAGTGSGVANGCSNTPILTRLFPTSTAARVKLWAVVIGVLPDGAQRARPRWNARADRGPDRSRKK